ncbi:MAG: hypothetical protein JKY62_17085 [Desulfocapsa sp.]|nr:hypothetical protein [Desulfocapsa sp.]
MKELYNVFLFIAVVLLAASSCADTALINKLQKQVRIMQSYEYRIVCDQRRKVTNVMNEVWGCMGIGRGLKENKN